MGLYAPLRTPDDIARLHPSDCANEPLPRRFNRYVQWNDELVADRQTHPFTYSEMRPAIIGGSILSLVALAGLALLAWLCLRA